MADWKNRLVIAAAGMLLVTILLLSKEPRAARAAAESPASAAPRYCVVKSEDHNLVVTDNATNTVYFYTLEKDKDSGPQLKLRGSLDLAQTGKSVIVPAKAKVTD